MGDVETVTAGYSCLVRTRKWLALCSLQTGMVEWRVDRDAPVVNESRQAIDGFCDMNLWGAKLWIDPESSTVAELFWREPDSLMLTARCMKTGSIRWQFVYRRPPLAAWAETSPAWPGAPQEEIYAFLAQAPSSLVLCIYRQTRCMGISTPEFKVFDRPPFHCQTDLVCFEPTSGHVRWSHAQDGLRLDVLDWKNFHGLWIDDEQAGWVDFETGTVSRLCREGYCFGRPAAFEQHGYFPWFDRNRKRIGYIRANSQMVPDLDYSWLERGVQQIVAWPTHRGVALQLNDQKIVWTNGDERLWNQRAKPYIYRIFASSSSDVWVATDGKGGRLFGFDPRTGNETYNFRPAMGGLGDMRLMNASLAVGSVCMHRSYSIAPKLFTFDVETQKMDFWADCWLLLGNWEEGVVFVTGDKNCRRVASLWISHDDGHSPRSEQY